MSTTIRLTPHGEELLKQQLSKGQYNSAEEVVERALESLAGKTSGHVTVDKLKAAAEAVARLRESRRGLSLGDLNIKELIEEGRKA